MLSPQIPGDRRIGADVSTGGARVTPAADGQVDRDESGVPSLMARAAEIRCSVAEMRSQLRQQRDDLRKLERENRDSRRRLVQLLETILWLDFDRRDSRVTRNSMSDVEFTVPASAECGTDINIGSHVIHVPRYSSVHYHLLQLVLFACTTFDDALVCPKSMALKSICKKLPCSIWTNPCHDNWISVSPKLEPPKKGTASGFGIRKSIHRWKETTERHSHQSDPDSSRADHGIKAAEAIWVVATSARQHATGDRDLLSGFITEHNDQFVHAAHKAPMKVLARGAVVTDAITLPDVWFVPGLTVNLVSVRQLAELDYSVGFGRGECCISADGKIVGKAHLHDGGLYVLDFLKVPLAI